MSDRVTRPSVPGSGIRAQSKDASKVFVKRSSLVKNRPIMRIQSVVTLMVAGTVLAWAVPAIAKKKAKVPAGPIAWLYVQKGPLTFSVSKTDSNELQTDSNKAAGQRKKGQPEKGQLEKGQLLPVFSTKEENGVKLAQVSAPSLETGASEVGWVEYSPAELKPLQAYPPDNELLEQLGPPYLDDFTEQHTVVVRFLVQQASGPPSLLCYIVSPPLSMAKLVVFSPNQASFSPGAFVNFPIDDLHAGISSFEVRDLLGDGSECVITKEPFREQVQTYGTNLYIRSFARGQAQVLWHAPIDYHNLSEYPPKIEVLRPPEKNIGAAGTVTTGSVSFRPNGHGAEPVWKGKVEFYAVGRDKAVSALPIEKTCSWDGKAFAPLR